jgi:hypothetical protein
MTITRHFPASDCIAAVIHDNEEDVAWVTFARDGTTVELDGISEIEVERWMSSSSVGRYWNSYLRGRY